MDCETELPIAANVSAGNIHDSLRATSTLQEGRHTIGRFHPRFFMADAGYSSLEMFRKVRSQYHATPIIKVNPSHKFLVRTRGAEEKTPAWKALYAQRTAVERTFSRLKGLRSLNSIRVRGLRKVTLHCLPELDCLAGSLVWGLSVATESTQNPVPAPDKRRQTQKIGITWGRCQ